jgi:hypothetical protein
MKPTFEKQAGINKPRTESKPSAIRQFVEINTHKNITIRREYMYLEDVKEAININTLEERIKLKKWLIRQLQKIQAQQATTGVVSKPNKILIQSLFDSSDKDRHTLQKRYRFTL